MSFSDGANPHPNPSPVEPGEGLSGSPKGFWRRRIRGYLVLPHLVPVLVVELATATFAMIAWGGLPPAPLLIPLLLAMLGGQLAIGATNELADLPTDSVGKPFKPLPSGDVTVLGARVMAVVGLLAMVALGLRFGISAFALLALGTGLGVAYDLWFKQTAWSWLPYLLALPLLPIWVFTALGQPEPRLLWLYPLGALATIGVHFAQALPDVAIDKQAGLPTATSRLGSGPSFLLSWLTTLSAPVLSWIAKAALNFTGNDPVMVIAAGLTILFMVANVAIIVVNRRIGIAACFPLVALSTLVNGLAWTLTVAH